MLTKDLHIERLSELNRSDFYKVLGMGEFGDCCYCVFWWQTSHEGWGERTSDQNRQFREGLFTKYVYDGFLLYINDVPQGWCQCGPRDQWGSLIKKYALAPEQNVWAITCFLLNPEIAGQGYAHKFLHELLADLKKQGIGKVQAFPHVGKNLSSEELWPGPISIYEKAGFSTLKADDQRPILEILL
ncbi:GNAT family N-acetyltransferase [bacterium]|nr:GNAT family N-acetyltransferase [bacterium]